MKSLIYLILIFFWFTSKAQVKEYVYSPKAHEANLEFNFGVRFSATSSNLQKEAEHQIELQLKYLFAGFSNNSRQAAPRLEHNVSNIKISNDGSGLYLANYHYHGKIVIQDGSNNYSFVLPLEPSNVYRRSFVVEGGRSENPCGDREHSEEEYYWYFLNTQAPECPLKEGVDFAVVQAVVSLLPSTTLTYPEYEKLVQTNNEIRVDVLFGMNDNSQSTSAPTSKDLNASSVRDLRKQLLALGFVSKIWSAAEIKRLINKDENYKLPFVEELTKKGGHANLKIRIFFGPSTLFEGDAFQSFFSDALKNSSAMIYAGHSGLGEYLDLKKMSEVSGIQFESASNRYQIYFFNGCSSYPYYADQYFDLKKSSNDPNGTKNLDIMTNGLSTYFVAISPSNKALISALIEFAVSGKRTSYQEIVNQADSGNLINILGDEDNN